MNNNIAVMKQLQYILITLFAAMLFAQCTKDEYPDTSTAEEQIAPLPQRNTALPQNAESLRVLAIGNSYTDDAVNYLNNILDCTTINGDSLCIYVASISSCSLQQWCNVLETSKPVTLRRAAGRLAMQESGTLTHLFAQHWDVIVFQQYSRLSDKFSSFNPYLNKLINSAVSRCTNQNVCIAWHLTWNYWIGYTSYITTTERYYNIVEAAKQMSTTNGIKTIIPTGTAVENARYSILQTPHELTRDGVHLSFGTGCYVAACTWFQSLIAPVFHVDLSDTKFIWTVTATEKNSAIYECDDVTEANYTICQRCAKDAIATPFDITQHR